MVRFSIDTPSASITWIPIARSNLPVDHDPVPVLPADREVRRRDDDVLVVDAGGDQHHPARLRVIDRLLDRSGSPRGPARCRRTLAGTGSRPGPTSPAGPGCGTSPTTHDARHPHARRAVVPAEVGVDARLIERPGELVARREVPGVERPIVGRRPCAGCGRPSYHSIDSPGWIRTTSASNALSIALTSASYVVGPCRPGAVPEREQGSEPRPLPQTAHSSAADPSTSVPCGR